MLTIHTISDLAGLPPQQQKQIQASIRTKDRLIDWLRARNSVPASKQLPEYWVRCPRCSQHPGKCRCAVEGHAGVCHCDAAGHQGWVENEDRGRDNSGIHPSGVTDCLKSLWYACAGHAPEHHRFVPPDLQLIFDMGHGWHHILQDFYGKAGAWCPPELYHAEIGIDPTTKTESGQPLQPIAAQYWIRGHADALLDDYRVVVDGIGEVSVRLVHEYKTIGDSGYRKLNKPQPKHLWQATIYAAVFDVPFVVYLYTNKNDSKLADFVIPFDARLWEEITKKIRAVQHYVGLGEMPPWEHTAQTLNPGECFECGYRTLCNPPGLNT